MKKHYLLFLAVAASQSAQALWAPMKEVPVDRLLENSQKKLQENPKDAKLHYVLGRLFSLKFAQQTNTYAQYGNEEEFAEWSQIQAKRESEKPVTDEDIQLLSSSLEHYALSLALQGDDNRARLGYAWMIEQAVPYVAQLSKVPWTKARPTKSMLQAMALTRYRHLFRITREADLRNQVWFGNDEELLSMEAGQGIVRILISQGKKNVENLKEVKDVRSHIKKLNQKSRAVTPIIFPIRAGATFADLVDNSARVKFDMAGDEVSRAWPWITRDGAFLVWDPSNTGKVTSGRQLFGSSTFWMFFRNGYEALASLDDDGNGWLEGRELRGISSWHDKNLNGKSDPGEVLPVTSLGVGAIRARAEGQIGDMPFQSLGIRWKDGRIGPTYDWIPTSK